MTEEKKVEEKHEVPGGMIERFFEQPHDAVSFYSDMAQVIDTGHEVILQFYETIPGPPEKGGVIRKVRGRLRATITLSHAHALNIGKLIMTNSSKKCLSCILYSVYYFLKYTGCPITMLILKNEPNFVTPGTIVSAYIAERYTNYTIL